MKQKKQLYILQEIRSNFISFRVSPLREVNSRGWRLVVIATLGSGDWVRRFEIVDSSSVAVNLEMWKSAVAAFTVFTEIEI